MPATIRSVGGLFTLMLFGFVGCGSGKGQPKQDPPTSAAPGTVGGQVATSGQLVKLIFPPGVLADGVQVTITPATGALPRSTGMVAGTAYTFGPSGTKFSSPVSITIRYDKSGLPAGAGGARLQIFKQVNDGWEPVPGSVADAGGGAVTAMLSSFSTYAILAVNPFVGEYAGDYEGSETGSAGCVVGADGSIQAWADSPSAGEFVGTGELDLSGRATFGARGAGQASQYTISFRGEFRQLAGNAEARGEWTSSSGYRGRWRLVRSGDGPLIAPDPSGGMGGAGGSGGSTGGGGLVGQWLLTAIEIDGQTLDCQSAETLVTGGCGLDRWKFASDGTFQADGQEQGVASRERGTWRVVSGAPPLLHMRSTESAYDDDHSGVFTAEETFPLDAVSELEIVLVSKTVLTLRDSLSGIYLTLTKQP